MNPFKFLALSGAGYLALVIVFGSGGEAAPSPTVRVPQTVQIVPLTQEQEADRQEAILQEIANLPVETTTTLPQLAQIDPDTKCQEWLPLAVEMGWPNETHILQRLGQVMWKESRCHCLKLFPRLAITVSHRVNATAHEDRWAEEIFGIPFEEAMADPAKNLRFAYLLWNSREEAGKCGWTPWSLPC
jgi:hypothetical protein